MKEIRVTDFETDWGPFTSFFEDGRLICLSRHKNPLLDTKPLLDRFLKEYTIVGDAAYPPALEVKRQLDEYFRTAQSIHHPLYDLRRPVLQTRAGGGCQDPLRGSGVLPGYCAGARDQGIPCGRDGGQAQLPGDYYPLPPGYFRGRQHWRIFILRRQENKTAPSDAGRPPVFH